MDEVTTASDASPVEDGEPTLSMTAPDPVDETPSASETEPDPTAGAETVVEPESQPESALELNEITEPEPMAGNAAGSATQPTLDDLIADLAVEGAPADVEQDAERAEGDASATPAASETDAAPEIEAGAAPEPVAPMAQVAVPKATEAPVEAGPMLERLWTHVPFWVIGGAWLVLTASMTALLWNATPGGVTGGIPYAALVFGGGVFVLIDLVAGLVISQMVRSRTAPGERSGLALAIWNRALLWTAGGVLLWWIGLLLLDLHHVAGIG
jgi:hypothetical protein